MMKVASRLRWELVLLAAGFVLLGAQALFEYSRHYTAVSIPVQKTPAMVRTGPFTLNYPGLYMIEYRVARTLPDRELACRLGVGNVERKQCSGDPPRVATSWTLRNDSGVVANGDSDDWVAAESSKDDFSAEIGTFRAGSFIGQRYSLDVTFRNNIPGLETANPALVVELHPISTKKGRTWLFELMACVFGTIFLIIGLFKTATGIWAASFDRRMDRNRSSKT